MQLYIYENKSLKWQRFELRNPSVKGQPWNKSF